MEDTKALITRKEDLELVAFILKTIGHPVRLKIIILLAVHESMTVNDIVEQCDTEQSLISHHLTNMKLKGILESRREGKYIYYSVKLKEVLNVIDCMANCKLK